MSENPGAPFAMGLFSAARDTKKENGVEYKKQVQIRGDSSNETHTFSHVFERK